MIPTIETRLGRAVVLVAVLGSMHGCFYMQAARGQLDVMNRREPIDELIAAEDTPADLAERLRLVEEARQFASDELLLPDNDSYRSYADLERDFVVWNVIAAPEFSLEAKEWCFPVAGCVNYRGYFSEDAARRKGARLAAAGYDVAIGGVAAYSTLGRLDDPVLNTMLRRGDVDLVALLFHELAHQKLYVKGDTAFNESFATAVEEFGIERWLQSRGTEQQLAGYYERRDAGRRLLRLVEQAREDLADIYQSGADAGVMRAEKTARLDRLADDLNMEVRRSGLDTESWLQFELNNARLASMALYDSRVPEFHAFFRDCDAQFECFYQAAQRLADSERDAPRRK